MIRYTHPRGVDPFHAVREVCHDRVTLPEAINGDMQRVEHAITVRVLQVVQCLGNRCAKRPTAMKPRGTEAADEVVLLGVLVELENHLRDDLPEVALRVHRVLRARITTIDMMFNLAIFARVAQRLEQRHDLDAMLADLQEEIGDGRCLIAVLAPCEDGNRFRLWRRATANLCISGWR